MGSHKMTVDALRGTVSEKISCENFSLTVLEGPHKGKSLHLNKEVSLIGRGEWCDLDLPDDPWVSTAHCECVLDEKGLRVRDLKSRNGIKLNDVPVLEAYFELGAKLQIGQSTLSLSSEQQKQELSIQFRDSTRTLLGKSMSMRKIFSLLPRIGQRKVITLLSGETGTGKTSIANAIHLQSNTKQAPFVVVNCGALPPSLIESALFGHERGAFTGAEKRHLGFFEQARGGTLFLDEIAELPIDLQPKLLDALERRKIRRLGSEVEHDVDFHLISATHKDLKEMCALGRFRDDLYFRLSVINIFVPPLRERKEDLPLLVGAFLKELSPEHPLYVTSEAMQVLKEYLWPGNIRELRNTLERSTIFLEGHVLDAKDIVLEKQTSSAPTRNMASPHPPLPSNEEGTWQEAFPAPPLAQYHPSLSLKDILKHVERFYIAQALEETSQNAPLAAQLLSLSESWLYSRIKLYGLKSKRKE